MSLSPLAKKLHIRHGYRIALLNAPADMADLISPLPAGTEVITSATGKADLVLLFVQNSAELATWIKQATTLLGDASNLWVAYPKLSSKIATDLTRDQGWQPLTSLDFGAVANVAVDTTWSAVRFRRQVNIGEKALLASQYAKERSVLLPLYQQLVAHAQRLGNDVELTTRQSYVAFTRGKQFALVKPSRNRLELALKLPNAPQDERLQAAAGVGSGSMTHRVLITNATDIDEQVISWLEQAYRASST